MIKHIFIIILTCLSVASNGQDSLLKVRLEQKLGTEIKDFTTDNLGNIYLFTSTNQIKKLDSKGDSVAVYNDVRRYGNIYSIDATNPLKVLVYYKDFSTVVVLDRLLNVRNIIDLRKQDIYQVRVITSSYDNNIWIYDELDSKLKKIDDNGRVLLESSDFRQVLDSVPIPVAMYDRDGQLYLYDNRKGLLIFDYYGALKNNLQILQLKDLQVIDKNTITGRDSTFIYLYKPSTLQMISYKAFDNLQKFLKINFSGNKLYCLSKEGDVELYTVTK